MEKVCHISTLHSLYDVRIFYKECRTLKNAGYDVYYIVTNEKSKTINGINIIGIPKALNRIERALKINFLALLKALKLKADIYHFHDPELIPIGIILKLYGRKVIYDLHEDVPNNILEKPWIKNTFIRKIISALYKAIEQVCVKIIDGVVIAVPDWRERFPPEKTIVLRNLVSLQLIDSIEPHEIKKDKLCLIYNGTLSENRGIAQIIKAMSYLDTESELWLFGKWSGRDFEDQCRSYHEWKYVKYFGRQKVENVYVYLKNADIGLHMPYADKKNQSGYPVKAFEFMACKLPFIITDHPSKRRNFSSCALFADPRKPEDIAEKIMILMNNGNMRLQLGEAGRKIIEKEFNWERESMNLVKFYRKLYG